MIEKLMKAQGTAMFTRGTAVEKGGFLVKQGKRLYIQTYTHSLSHFLFISLLNSLSLIKKNY
jgi:hypothetical protein